MAYIKINNVSIKGMSACVPTTIEENGDYPYFDENELERMMPTIGIERRRVLKSGQTSADLAFKAADKLIEELGWEKDSINLLIYCSPARDYIYPDTACILQDRLGLPRSTMAFDMNLGCTGWSYGLTTLCSIIQNGFIKRGLLLNGSMGTAECAYTDKTSYPLFCDTGAATAVEFNENAPSIWCELGTDGAGYDDIIIPDGGRRNPVTEKSLELIEYDTNIKRSRLHVEMKGLEVFSFGLKTAPKSLDSVLEFAGKTKEEIDLFIFHQANYYMVKKIIKKLKIDPEKAPFSLLNYGNTGSCSIPFTMITERGDRLRKGFSKNAACTFGVGLSWSSIYFETENLEIPELQIMD